LVELDRVVQMDYLTLLDLIVVLYGEFFHSTYRGDVMLGDSISGDPCRLSVTTLTAFKADTFVFQKNVVSESHQSILFLIEKMAEAQIIIFLLKKGKSDHDRVLHRYCYESRNQSMNREPCQLLESNNENLFSMVQVSKIDHNGQSLFLT
jgi:hypothetical protein